MTLEKDISMFNEIDTSVDVVNDDTIDHKDIAELSLKLEKDKSEIIDRLLSDVLPILNELVKNLQWINWWEEYINKAQKYIKEINWLSWDPSTTGSDQWSMELPWRSTSQNEWPRTPRSSWWVPSWWPLWWSGMLNSSVDWIQSNIQMQNDWNWTWVAWWLWFFNTGKSWSRTWISINWWTNTDWWTNAWLWFFRDISWSTKKQAEAFDRSEEMNKQSKLIRAEKIWQLSGELASKEYDLKNLEKEYNDWKLKKTEFLTEEDKKKDKDYFVKIKVLKAEIKTLEGK
jgi:hypothetical protein